MMSNSDQLLKQAVMDQRSPTQEAYYGQIDPNLIALILQNCTATHFLDEKGIRVEKGSARIAVNPKTGEPITETEITRPDIYNYYIALSHLTRTSNLTKDKARHYWFLNKQMLRRSRAKYRSNPDIMNLLGQVKNALFIVTFGDAESGKRQKYLSTSIRGVQIMQSSEKEGPWWAR